MTSITPEGSINLSKDNEVIKTDNNRALRLLSGPGITLKCSCLHIPRNKREKFKEFLGKKNDQRNKNSFTAHFRPGEITQICSFNEKTTYSLVHTLRGLRHYSTGDISVSLMAESNSGTTIASGNKYSILRSIMPKISINFDTNDGIIGCYTVGRILHERASLICSNLTHDDRDFFINWIMKRLDLLHLETQKIGSANEKGLSTGQRRRLSLALLLLHRPRVLFLNNFLVGLDSITANTLVDFIRYDLAKICNCTIILTGADIPAINWRIFDNILMMSSGGTLINAEKRLLSKMLVLCDYYEANDIWRKMQSMTGKGRLNVTLERIEYDNPCDIRIMCNAITMLVEAIEHGYINIKKYREALVTNTPSFNYLEPLRVSNTGDMPEGNKELQNASLYNFTDRWFTSPLNLFFSNYLYEICEACECYQEEFESASSCSSSESDEPEKLNFGSNVCIRCWWHYFHWRRNHFLQRIWHCIRITASIKILPITSFIGAWLAYAALGALLGYVFWDIPGRIENNPANSLVENFYNEWLPSYEEWLTTEEGSNINYYIQDLKRLLQHGVGGDAENGDGPRPIIETLTYGIDGSGRTPIKDLVSEASTFLWLRCTGRCIYSRFPFNREQYGYPSADMYEPNFPCNMTRLQNYECIKDIENLEVMDILTPEETITDIVALAQVLHFILVVMDIDGAFPGLEEAFNMNTEGMEYWLPVIEKGLGLFNILLECLELPPIPCLGNCNQWPDAYTPCDPAIKGDCSVKVSINNNDNPQSLSQLLGLDVEAMQERISTVSSAITQVFAKVEKPNEQEVPFYWSDRYDAVFRKIFPVDMTGSTLIASLIHPKGYASGTLRDEWQTLIRSVESSLTVVADTCQTEWCQNILEFVREVELTLWNLFEILWQILNTVGCVFAMNAAIPFLTMEDTKHS